MEDRLHALVISGRLDLRTAQHEMGVGEQRSRKVAQEKDRKVTVWRSNTYENQYTTLLFVSTVQVPDKPKGVKERHFGPNFGLS